MIPRTGSPRTNFRAVSMWHRASPAMRRANTSGSMACGGIRAKMLPRAYGPCQRTNPPPAHEHPDPHAPGRLIPSRRALCASARPGARGADPNRVGRGRALLTPLLLARAPFTPMGRGGWLLLSGSLPKRKPARQRGKSFSFFEEEERNERKPDPSQSIRTICKSWSVSRSTLKSRKKIAFSEPQCLFGQGLQNRNRA